MLRGIDWRVAAGDRWVILGPNGSGKTTLLQVAGARLWPTAGTVEVLGARLGEIDVRTLRPRADVPAVRDFTAEVRERLPAAAGHAAPR